jgi:hypothetical protein
MDRFVRVVVETHELALSGNAHLFWRMRVQEMTDCGLRNAEYGCGRTLAVLALFPDAHDCIDAKSNELAVVGLSRRGALSL